MTTDTRTRPDSAPANATPRHRRGRFNVFAAFEQHDRAQHALEALGRAGFEGADISLKGPPDPATAADTAAADARVMKHWFAAVITWGAVGAVVGFILGIPVGIVVIEAFTSIDLNMPNVLVAAMLSAIGLSTVAGLAAMIWPVHAGDAWERAFYEEHGRRIIVGLHLDDREAAERALSVLHQTDAVDTYITGAKGRSSEIAHESSS